MKKLRSLVASFALATAGLTGLTAAQPAAAQTVYTQQAVNPAYVSQDAINDIAQNLGVQAIYPRAGKGFTQGQADTGENIGLEFQLNGNGTATVIRAFNVDDPYAARAYMNAQNEASIYENRVSRQFNSGYYDYPRSYNFERSLLPIIGLGLLFSNNHHHYNDNRYYRDDHRRYEAPRRWEQPRFEQPRFEPRHDAPRFEPRHDRGGDRNWNGGDRGHGGGPRHR